MHKSQEEVGQGNRNRKLGKQGHRSRRSLVPLKDSHVTELSSSRYIPSFASTDRTERNRAERHSSKDISLHLNKSFQHESLAFQTMEGYGLSEEELFASSLHNFTWENSFEQVGDSSPVSTSARCRCYTSTFCHPEPRKWLSFDIFWMRYASNWNIWI